jgi:two-component system phosphate regulon sensor histidine kinase PhoR
VLVAVVAIGVLAYEAVGLDRSHRAVAENVLRDYSAFAADQFSRLASERLTALTRRILAPVACGASTGLRQAASVGRVASASANAGSSCANPAGVEGFFELDGGTRQVAFTAGDVAPAIRDTITGLPLKGPAGLLLLPFGNDGRVVGYWHQASPGAKPYIAGFVAAVALLRPVFDDIVQNERLLPGSLAGAAQNRRFLAIDVRDDRGMSIYRSGEPHAPASATRHLGTGDGNMEVRLGINEAAAGRLIIGGVPQSRLPMLVSLLAVAVGLLSIGGWQAYREHRMARMRVDFVRSASHELKTPLAQMRLFAETLQLGRVRSWSEVVRSLDFLDQQTRRLSHLVDNLLTFAHGGRRRRARIEALDLATFVPEVARGFQPIMDSLGQTLAVEIGDAAVVRADREWLTQVVLNLLDNATKYGPSGQTVLIRAVRHVDAARISVEDQGPGVPPGERQRIFEPFVRLGRDHERRSGGTGIGLAVAAELMTAMAGRIWAAESPNGARFMVELPLAEAGDARYVA